MKFVISFRYNNSSSNNNNRRKSFFNVNSLSNFRNRFNNFEFPQAITTKFNYKTNVLSTITSSSNRMYSKKTYIIPDIPEVLAGPQVDSGFDHEKSVEKYCREGIIARDQNNLDEAYRLFTEAIELSGNSSPRAFGLRGDLLQLNKRYKEAILDYNALLSMTPNHIPSYCAIANCYLQMGEHENALTRFNQIVSAFPEYIPGYIGRGDANMKLSNYSEAIKDYKHVIGNQNEHIPLNGIRKNLASSYFSTLRIHEALALYKLLITEESDDPVCWIGYGDCHYILEDYENALAGYSKALKLKCKNPIEIHTKRGSCYLNLNMPEKGLEDCDYAVVLGNGKMSHLLALFRGRALFECDEYSEAVGDFNYYLKRADSDLPEKSKSSMEIILDHNKQVSGAHAYRALALIFWYIEINEKNGIHIVNPDKVDMPENGVTFKELLYLFDQLDRTINENRVDPKLSKAFLDLKNAKVRDNQNFVILQGLILLKEVLKFVLSPQGKLELKKKPIPTKKSKKKSKKNTRRNLLKRLISNLSNKD